MQNVKPIIKFSKEFVEITIDTKRIEVEGNKFQKLISLCEKAKFEEAKILADANMTCFVCLFHSSSFSNSFNTNE